MHVKRWREVKYKPGVKVRVPMLSGTARVAVVVENRGPIGVGGRVLLLVRMVRGGQEFEIPAEELVPYEQRET